MLKLTNSYFQIKLIIIKNFFLIVGIIKQGRKVIKIKFKIRMKIKKLLKNIYSIKFKNIQFLKKQILLKQTILNINRFIRVFLMIIKSFK